MSARVVHTSEVVNVIAVGDQAFIGPIGLGGALVLDDLSGLLAIRHGDRVVIEASPVDDRHTRYTVTYERRVP